MASFRHLMTGSSKASDVVRRRVARDMAARAMFAFVLGMGWLTLSSHSAMAGLTFQFDYRYDSRGYFNDPVRREALEAAGRLVNRYVDNLDAIKPTPPTNTWSSFFTPPDERPAIILSNLEVPQDTMQIFVGGAKIAGRLAQSIDTAPLGFGDDDWEDTVHYRGQTGASASPATDFGPMGGTITFNDDPTEFQWHYGLSTEGIKSTEFDFITVAAHEMLHLLGIGISKSWSDHVNGANQFTGVESVAVSSPTNATLTLDAGEAHWKSGTRSTWNGKLQEALLAPGIFPGRRAFATSLDRAALRDLGWEEASAGDATRDRAFNSDDLLAVFQAGRYETNQLAGWADGDWNDDALFDSADLIKALQTGTYEQPGAPAVSASLDLLQSQLTINGSLADPGKPVAAFGQLVPEPSSFGLTLLIGAWSAISCLRSRPSYRS